MCPNRWVSSVHPARWALSRDSRSSCAPSRQTKTRRRWWSNWSSSLTGRMCLSSMRRAATVRRYVLLEHLTLHVKIFDDVYCVGDKIGISIRNWHTCCTVIVVSLRGLGTGLQATGSTVWSRCNRLRCPMARWSGLQCYNFGHNGHGINLYGVIMTLMGNLHVQTPDTYLVPRLNILPPIVFWQKT